jgi:hypothetical protein
MIRYHGGPITPETAAAACWRRSHAMVSFANPDQAAIAFAVADSVTLDNGAWPIFASGQGRINVDQYMAWVETWHRHPACDWCLVPDIIDGTEQENDELIRQWDEESTIGRLQSVPVWHMHESIDKVRRLCEEWPRVAIGSSGDYVTIGTPKWWGRISQAMEAVCDDGEPIAKLHGLRQMDPTIFSVVPYASVDSTNVARNIGIDSAWTGSYIPKRKETRAMLLRDNIEHHPSAARWNGPIMRNMELFA